MSASIGIIGAGAWGTALAIAVARAGHQALLWGRDSDRMAVVQATRQSDALPGVTLPEAVRPVREFADIAALPVLVLAVPTQALRGVLQAMLPVALPGAVLVIAAKGIEQGSGAFVSEVVRACLPRAKPAVLSGPSFAADVARGLPTAVTLAAEEEPLAAAMAELIGSAALRIYHTTDLRGVEIGGAAKNVLAIAAGIVAGAGLGESARAAVVTRGFAELRRFAAACGARPETLMGLSGLGDLMLTASSPQSRNYALGVTIGGGAGMDSGGKLAEGAFTAPVLVEKARALGVEMPIAEQVAAILAGTRGVREAIAALIERPQRAEG